MARTRKTGVSETHHSSGTTDEGNRRMVRKHSNDDRWVRCFFRLWQGEARVQGESMAILVIGLCSLEKFPTVISRRQGRVGTRHVIAHRPSIPIRVRAPRTARVPHHSLVSSNLKISTMATHSQEPHGREGALPLLNVAIEVLNLAQEISSITPARAVFGSASVVLSMIRVRCFSFCDNEL